MKKLMLFPFLFFIVTISLFNCSKEKPMDDIIKVKPNDTTDVSCQLTITEKKVLDALNNGGSYLFESAIPVEEENGKLDALVDYLGDVNFVGLGEGTHGTAEFYKMKDKIFRLLVEKKGFKAIIFELPWGQTMKINDYVFNGVGTARNALLNTDYWVYSAKAVIDLIEWMHDFNKELDDKDKIYFVGCDIQGNSFEREKSIIRNFVINVEPDSVGLVSEKYKYLPVDLFKYKKETKVKQLKNIAGTKYIYDYILKNRDRFIELSSEFEYELALMASHVIQNREIVYREGEYGVMRDRLMAYYTQWWQKIFGNSSKVAIWAHNFHISVVPNENFGSMGTFLRKKRGSNYKNVGFSFEKGSLTAFLAGSNFEFVSPVKKQSITKNICYTTNHLLSEIEGNNNYIIFNELDGDAEAYFAVPHKFFQCGAGFNPTYVKKYIHSYPLSKYYDVIIHFDKTTNSKLIY